MPGEQQDEDDEEGLIVEDDAALEAAAHPMDSQAGLRRRRLCRVCMRVRALHAQAADAFCDVQKLPSLDLNLDTQTQDASNLAPVSAQPCRPWRLPSGQATRPKPHAAAPASCCGPASAARHPGYAGLAWHAGLKVSSWSAGQRDGPSALCC